MKGAKMRKSKGLLVIVEVMRVVYQAYSDWVVASPLRAYMRPLFLV